MKVVYLTLFKSQVCNKNCQGRNNRMKVVLFGAGGNGRELMPILVENFLDETSCGLQDFQYIETNPKNELINSIVVISEDDFFQQDLSGQVLFNVSISDPKTRLNLVNKFLSFGYQPVEIISKEAKVSTAAKLALGVTVSPFALISPDVTIGNFSQINYFASVSHDVNVGNFVTIGPGARINGYIRIEDEVYIGAQATIKPGSITRPRIIGKGSVIGMGAVVLDDVQPYSTVVGNPARKLQ